MWSLLSHIYNASTSGPGTWVKSVKQGAYCLALLSRAVGSHTYLIPMSPQPPDLPCVQSLLSEFCGMRASGLSLTSPADSVPQG